MSLRHDQGEDVYMKLTGPYCMLVPALSAHNIEADLIPPEKDESLLHLESRSSLPGQNTTQ